MKKTILKTTWILCSAVILAACSNAKQTDSDETTEAPVEENTEVVTEEPPKEESALGQFSGLVGNWTVDATTAGVQVDITFEEDGTFKQKMGTLDGTGTWEVSGDDRILIKTQHTDGQTWKITDLNENSVNVTWNPDKPKPKTIPFQRVN